LIKRPTFNGDNNRGIFKKKIELIHEMGNQKKKKRKDLRLNLFFK
jgi:hypothetical protein